MSKPHPPSLTPSGIPAGIDYFNRGHWLSRIQAQVSLKARRRMFETWTSWLERERLPRARVLDIGATPDVERVDSNCFLPWIHELGSKIDCWSPEPIQGIQSAFPFIEVIPPAAGPSQGGDRRIPVRDASYDCATSSAVLEHVGTSADQERFIAEHARVARSLFLTTPNRRHWLEFHTKLPLLHWLPRPLHRAILRLLGMRFWAKESNLRLVSRRELQGLAARALGNDWSFEVRSVWALGMPSNLVLLARRRLESKVSRGE